MGGHTVPCRMFSSNTGLYPLMPVALPSQYESQKCLQTLLSVSWCGEHGAKSPPVRNLWATGRLGFKFRVCYILICKMGINVSHPKEFWGNTEWLRCILVNHELSMTHSKGSRNNSHHYYCHHYSVTMAPGR